MCPSANDARHKITGSLRKAGRLRSAVARKRSGAAAGLTSSEVPKCSSSVGHVSAQNLSKQLRRFSVRLANRIA